MALYRATVKLFAVTDNSQTRLCNGQQSNSALYLKTVNLGTDQSNFNSKYFISHQTVTQIFTNWHTFFITVYRTIMLLQWNTREKKPIPSNLKLFYSIVHMYISGRQKSWLLISSLLPPLCVWLPLQHFFPVSCIYDTTPVKISSA